MAYAALALLFLAGLSIMLYPAVSDKWNQHRAEELMTAYTQAARVEGEGNFADLEAARKYNRSLIGTPVPDAFSQREGVEDPEYEALLNVSGNGMIGSLEIPVIGVNLPIYHYTSEESLKKGVGHLFGSSLPVGGKSSHSVLSAHRGLPSAELFTNLNLVEEGDTFYIRVLNQTLAYEVDRIQVVEPWETDSLAIEEGQDYVTLVTCTPYAVNTQRLLVRGHRIEYTEEKYEAQAAVSEERMRDFSGALMQGLCVLLGLLLAVLFVGLISRRERRRE